jgi:ribosome biogenesis GTPase
MNNEHPELNGLGWCEWFEARSQREPGQTIARVIAVDRELLLLADQDGPFRARLAGSFMHRLSQPHELPCVGDWVRLEKEAGGGFGVVHGVLERRTSLRRKSAGSPIQSQMIAANVDCVVIVQSCHFDFNVNRLERYLVMVMDGGADPQILLTKTDLVEPGVLDAQLEQIRSAGIRAPVTTLSNVTGDGVDALQRSLLPGRTYCFVGSSGVGKSTLINWLMGCEAQETGNVSATGEGRHTTVRRELIRLTGGAMVIDNPGMREFGILGAASGIESSYADITTLAASCRFADCNHQGEPGCAVIEALNSGELSREQYENHQKLRAESEFHEMSYAQKRKKDRDFGRFLKSVKKDLGYD